MYDLKNVGGIRYNLRLYIAYIRVNWISAIEFRMGFLTILFQILMSVFIWFVYWNVILNKTSGLFSGWSATQLIIWYALTEFSIGMLGMGSGLIVLIFIIHQDGLEQYLSKPVHVLVSASADQMYVLSLIRALFGFVVLIIAIFYFKLLYLWGFILSAILISLLGAILIIMIYILVISLSFYLGRIQTVYSMLMDLEINFTRLPMHVFPKQIFLSLLFIYPIGMLATLPTLLIFQQWWFVNYGWMQLLLLDFAIIIFTIILAWIALRIFNYSLRYYIPVGE